jgi:hypothetical protein
VSVRATDISQAALTQFLRELPTCVVLRNEADLFENLARGGDIDVLVADLKLAERTLIRHLGPPIRVVRSSYVTGYSYDWGHIDLLPTIEWRGACYLTAAAVLKNGRLSARGRLVPRPAHEALISWLANILFAGCFKERYSVQIRSAVATDGYALRQALLQAAGNTWGDRLWHAAVEGHPELSASWTPSLRRVVWWRAWVRSPRRTIHRFFAHVVAELRLRFAPPVPCIAILGGDSRETSSLANEVVRRFAACPYAHVKLDHRHPRAITSGRNADPVADLRERGPGPIRSIMTLFVLAIDWLVGYWTRLAPLRAKGYIVAFEGVHFDLVADPLREPCQWPRLARVLSWLLPKPDIIFVLDSEPDVRSLGSRPRRHALDARLPLNLLVDEIQGVIRAWMSDRALASLGNVSAAIPTASPPSASRWPTSASRT